MTEDTFYNWAIRGVHGGLNIIELVLETNAVPNASVKEEFDKLMGRMEVIRQKIDRLHNS